MFTHLKVFSEHVLNLINHRDLFYSTSIIQSLLRNSEDVEHYYEI